MEKGHHIMIENPETKPSGASTQAEHVEYTNEVGLTYQ